jgi:hypothetical protein
MSAGASGFFEQPGSKEAAQRRPLVPSRQEARGAGCYSLVRHVTPRSTVALAPCKRRRPISRCRRALRIWKPHSRQGRPAALAASLCLSCSAGSGCHVWGRILLKTGLDK